MPVQPRFLPEDLFAFAGADRGPLYTALLYAFGEANEQLLTSLALDDVRAHLLDVGWPQPPDDAELTAALQQLRNWQLVDAGQNHSEHYRTAHEYERRNLQYSLTRNGEAALAGHQAAVSALESTGGLQTAVLDAIAETLARLARLAQALPDADPTSASEASTEQRRSYAAFQELTGHLDALRTGVRTFNSDLQRLLRADEVDDTVFGEVKEATVRYLDDYVTRLDDRTARIRHGIDRVRSAGLDRLLSAALAGAELPPHPRPDERDAQWLDAARARWAGLEAWFAPADGVQPRAQLLSATARRAIVSLLQVVDRMRTARRRPSSAQADLRRLAQLFAAAPADDDLHRLWRAAFGLHPARHTHLGHADPELVPNGASWAEADPVPVSALLRETGQTEKFSRPSRVRDVAEVRAQRAARARAERAAAEQAIRALGTDGPIRISQLTSLNTDAFTAFLDLLGRAVANPPRAGRLHAKSADGRVEVTLTIPGDGGRAVLRTTTGTLECPDYELSILAPHRRVPVVAEASS
ncbi:MAG: TIGR02677 family protein [Micropruina sp.]|uniref:TIGR02677 family protein n=1 Tax=Micropruina sp. TaxID=2737536 RepID=UPI0039E5E064